MKRDITEQITKVTEVPNSLRKYDRMMKNREKEVDRKKENTRRYSYDK